MDKLKINLSIPNGYTQTTLETRDINPKALENNDIYALRYVASKLSYNGNHIHNEDKNNCIIDNTLTLNNFLGVPIEPNLIVKNLFIDIHNKIYATVIDEKNDTVYSAMLS